jgi:WD40 repeat protein
MFTERFAKGRVHRLQFTPDGGSLIVEDAGSRQVDFTESVRWWGLASRKETRTEIVNAQQVAVAADGSALAAYLFDDETEEDRLIARVLAGGREIELPTTRTADVLSMGLTPNGSKLVASCFDDAGRAGKYRLYQWDLAAKAKPTVVDVPGVALALQFSRDAALLATGSSGNDRFVRVYRMPKFERLAEMKADGSATRGLAFSPDGKLLAAAVGKVVHLWESGTGKPILTVKGAKGGQVNGVAFAPDGRRLAAVYQNGEVVLWDVAGGAESARFAWQIGKATSIAFSPDGLVCAAGGDKGLVVVWDVDE